MSSIRHQTALVVAHPGHELRVYGWLEKTRPLVFILTDGSGGTGVGRLESSRRLLMQTGAELSCLIGPYANRDLYSAILAGEHDLFVDLVDRLAEAFSHHGVTTVAGDATEGYNPGHDACRLIIDAAVECAEADTAIENYAFPLTGRPDKPPPNCDPSAKVLSLDDAAFARKRAAAENYFELKHEVQAAVDSGSWDTFRKEFLYPSAGLVRSTALAEAPYYERYGEQQVKSGRYRDVLRYREHFRPLGDAVRSHVRRRLACLAGAS